MIGSDDLPTVVELEQRVLHALCSRDISPALQHKLMQDLHRHEWRIPEHRIVYEALAALLPADVAALRERLPAQATRMGFPDVDWDSYFKSDKRSEGKLTVFVARLMRAGAETR
jgi:hypothetical protein